MPQHGCGSPHCGPCCTWQLAPDQASTWLWHTPRLTHASTPCPQAREALAAQLRAQLEAKRAALQRVQQAAGQVDSLMAAAAQQLEQALGDSAQSAEARHQGMELG